MKDLTQDSERRSMLEDQCGEGSHAGKPEVLNASAVVTHLEPSKERRASRQTDSSA